MVEVVVTESSSGLQSLRLRKTNWPDSGVYLGPKDRDHKPNEVSKKDKFSLNKLTEDFPALWKNACREESPDPNGAAGKLMKAFGDLLDVEQVEYAKIEREALFLFDLSTLGFKGLDLNVLMVHHPPKNKTEARIHTELLADYTHSVKSIGFCFQIILSNNKGKVAVKSLATAESVSIFGNDLSRLFESKLPAAVLFEIIRRQVHLEKLCPFDTTREARSDTFRGRRKELDALISKDSSPLMVTGARRIGKTSLIRRAYNILRVQQSYRDLDASRQRVFFLNCLNLRNRWDCYREMAHEIDVRSERRIEKDERNTVYMLERQSRGGRAPLVLFFDELDRLVESDESDGWPLFSMLKKSVDAGWIRVIFAGYRSMQRLRFGHGIPTNSSGPQVPDSPFYGSMRELSLEPLTKHETESLLREPLESVGIKISKENEILSRIWKSTAGYPYLVQFYGEQLFRRASSSITQEIKLLHLEEVEQGDELGEFLESHFLENTLDGGMPIQLERLCVYLIAYLGGGQDWVKSDFWEQCQKHITFNHDELHNALRNLKDAGILAVSGDRYRIATPILCQKLKRAFPDLEILLETVVSKY